MRKAFIAELTRLAHEDRRIFLLTGDLGWNALEPFRDAHPTRFINVGVAEQNMIGVATGLAEAGYLPFCYSIATFATMRGYEFIRNGPVAHGLPVKIIGMGGGFEYGTAGHTHHALEDIALMRALPDVQIVAPADWRQAAAALRETWHHGRVTYYRLGKDDSTEVPGLNGHFSVGEVAMLARHAEPRALVLATGAVAVEAVRAVEMLAPSDAKKVDIGVVSTFNPPPLLALDPYPLVVTVEEHGANGGLGSLVAERIAGCGYGSTLIRACAHEGYLSEHNTGSQAWLRKLHRLDAVSIAHDIEDGLVEVEHHA